jgi:hypothetical protein
VNASDTIGIVDHSKKMRKAEEEASEAKTSGQINDITKLSMLKMLLYPDLKDIILFFLAIFFSHVVFRSLIQTEYSDPILIPVLGLIAFTFYGLRNGYTSLYDAIDKRRKIMDELSMSEETGKIIVEIKLIGIIVSTFIIFYGYSIVQF